MAIKTPKPEEIFVNLRQVQVRMGQGMHAEYGSYKARLIRTLFCQHSAISLPIRPRPIKLIVEFVKCDS